MTKMRHIIVFARAPEAGRVKTRLAAGIGASHALQIYRWLGQRTLAAIRAVSGCTHEVRFTPPDTAGLLEDWLGPVARRAQSEGDLGERMRGAVRDAIADGATDVVVVGTDCPALDADIIQSAFVALQRADVVLGPATDGGYYLIALKEPHEAVFRDIPWSTCETLACTLEAVATAGLRCELLDPLDDIDTAEDWARWCAAQATAPPHELPAPAVQP